MKGLTKQLRKLGTKAHMSNSLLCLCGTKRVESKSVPRGCLPVYVGNEGHRFVVDIHFLNHPLFEKLL